MIILLNLEDMKNLRLILGIPFAVLGVGFFQIAELLGGKEMTKILRSLPDDNINNLNL